MPIMYDVDARRRWLLLTATGVVTADETLGVIDRQIAEGHWTYGMLYDIRDAENLPKPSAIFTILEYVRKQVEQHGPRGPIAIVAPASRNLQRVRTYTSLTESTRLIVATFDTVGEASIWLMAQTAPGEAQ
jgi:hypothetical protein